MVTQVNRVDVALVGFDDFGIDHRQFFQALVQLVAAEDDVQPVVEPGVPDEALIQQQFFDFKVLRCQPRCDELVVLQDLFFVAVRPVQGKQLAQFVVVRDGEGFARRVKVGTPAPAHDRHPLFQFDFDRIRPAFIDARLGNPVQPLHFVGEQGDVHVHQVALVVVADDLADFAHVAVAQRLADDDPFQWKEVLLQHALVDVVSGDGDGDQQPGDQHALECQADHLPGGAAFAWHADRGTAQPGVVRRAGHALLNGFARGFPARARRNPCRRCVPPAAPASARSSPAPC